MISIDLRSHVGLLCPSCGKSVAALVDGVTPGHAECVGCVADELWPEMFATLRLLRDEIDAVLRASNPCMGCRAAGLPKCDFACERATAYDAIRREGREQVYAELRRVDPPWHGSKSDFVTDLIGDVRARLDPDFRLDIEARASGPDVARLGAWIDDGFRVGETREFVIPGVDANPGTMQITGITDTVLTVESAPVDAGRVSVRCVCGRIATRQQPPAVVVDGRPHCPWCDGPCQRGLCPVWSE